MAEQHPADELKTLRDLLRRLESGELRMVLSGADVSQREAGILKREIAHLETILERLNAGKAS